MKNLKKPISIILVFLMLLSVFAATPVSVSAETIAEKSAASEEKTTDQENTDESFEIESDDVTEPSKAETAEPETTEPETQKPQTTKKKALYATGADENDFKWIPYGKDDNGNLCAQVTGYKGAGGSISIPSTFTNDDNTYSVVSIGSGAFSGCTDLTGVGIPGGVTSIGDYAFSGCTSLTGVTFPSSLRNIGSNAFNSCRSLTSVIIPNSVTGVGEAAFLNCYNLTDLTVRGDYDFPYDARYDTRFPYENIKTLNVTGTAVVDYAFQEWSGLETVTLRDSVTTIGDYAFDKCQNLSKISMSNVVSSIGDYAFSDCETLTDFTIPSGVTNIGAYAFSNCSCLIGITIPSGVTEIKEGTFQGCLCLRGVTIPSNITSIGDLAFQGCTSFAYLFFSEGITNIGNGAFQNCVMLEKVSFPVSLTSIGIGAFMYCIGLHEVIIPDSDETVTIDKTAFAGCSDLNLKDLYIPENVELGEGDVFVAFNDSTPTIYGEIPSPWYDYYTNDETTNFFEFIEYPNTPFYYKKSDDTYKYTDTIEEAWAEAISADESTVGLFVDVELSSTLVVPKDKKITLELNGCTIDRGLTDESAVNGGNVITVSEGATLNIYGGKEYIFERESEKTVSAWNSDNTTRTEKISNKGLITGGYSATDGGGIKVEKDGNLNLYCTAVMGNRTNTNGGGIALTGENAKLKMEESEVSYNLGSNGGGFCISGDYCEVSGNTVILDNTSLENGGGLCIVGKYLETSGEIKISGNTANNNGGGVYVGSDSCKMTGKVKISDNTAQRNGGGIYTNSGNGLFKFKSCSVKNNSATDGKGGGIYNGKSTNRFYNITVTENAAGSDGDGVFTKENIDLYKECRIFDNDKNGSGNNLYLACYSDNVAYIDDSLSGDSEVYVTYGVSESGSAEHPARLTKNEGTHDTDSFKYDTSGYHFEYISLTSDSENKGHIIRKEGQEPADSAVVHTEGNYQYIVSKGKATITKYIGSANKVVIPSTLGGYPVTCIGVKDAEKEAEYKRIAREYKQSGNDYSIVEVITNKEGAFSGNGTITSVTIPSCVKTIGFNAFKDCPKLTDVTISDGVEKIWTYAFHNCPKFKKLVLPKSINFIANRAFDGSVVMGNTSGGTSYADGITDLTMYTNFDFDYRNLPYSSVKHLTISDGSTEIPNSAFERFYFLETVTIPKDLKRIGNSAFKFCSNLHTLCPNGANYDPLFDAYEEVVEIPRSVTYIGSEAFRGCFAAPSVTDDMTWEEYYEKASGIRKVILHRGLTYIGDWAFESCARMNHIMLPKGLQYLGKGAFAQCNSLTEMSIPPGVAVRIFTFAGCTSLRSLNLHAGAALALGAHYLDSQDYDMYPEYFYGPDGDVRSSEFFEDGLAHSTFEDSNCQEMTIACDRTAHIIGHNAFGYYYKDKVTILSRPMTPACFYAFANGYIWGGGDVGEFIDEDSEVEQNPMKRDFNTFMGILGSVGASVGDIMGYIGSDLELNLPEFLDNAIVKRIAANAFKDLDITEIKVPTSVEEIKEYAFSGCKKLTKAAIEEGLKEIGSYAFENCSDLVDIDLPESLTDLGDAVFEGCSALKDIELPDGIKALGSELFSNCLSLKDIKLPSDLKTIGDKAFSACKSLTDIELPATLTELKNSVFKDCIKLKNIELPDGVKDLGNAVFSGCTSLTDIELPDSITRLGDSMFENCKSLTRVELPSGITSIGYHMFSDCTSLTDIEIPDGVTSIGEKAFSNCKSLTSITIPDSVTSIADNAFEGCTSLREINLPEGLTSLGEAAFKDCKNIMSDINIPDSVKQIGEKAFYGCSNIRNIKLPEELTSIGDSAFKGCSKLKSIEIPDGVTSIGGEVFSGCSNLEYITIPASVTSIGSDLVAHDAVFENCEKATIYCPVDSYMADYWPYGANAVVSYTLSDGSAEINRRLATCYGTSKIVVPSTIECCPVTSLAENAFEGFVDFPSISLPDALTNIGDKAFNGCSGLTSIEIPDSVENIGDNAFYGCSKITSIALPDSLTNIGDNAFKSCSKLTSVNIPDSVEKIGKNAFSSCSNLASVKLSDSLTKIGEETFKDCSKLESITIPDSVEAISASAFSGCSQIKDLDLPATVQSLGESAFANCTNIETAFIRGRTTEIGANAFNNCTSLKTIYAYDSSPADAYAKNEDISFIPLLKTNTGSGYEDVPLTETQLVEDDGNAFELSQNTYGNIEFLGAQIKPADTSKNIRFLAVINEGIVSEATNNRDIVDYGFVIAGCSSDSTADEGETNIQKVTVDSPEATVLSCRKTSNKICGDYGIYHKNTKYKYVTLAVNNVDPNQGFVVRFYIKTKSGRVYYSTYNADYTGCVASYNRIATIREGDDSALFKEDWEQLVPFPDD